MVPGFVTGAPGIRLSSGVAERRYGHYVRGIRLSGVVDAKNIKGKITDGVLEVTLPKPGNTKSRSASGTGPSPGQLSLRGPGFFALPLAEGRPGEGGWVRAAFNSCARFGQPVTVQRNLLQLLVVVIHDVVRAEFHGVTK